MMRKIILLFFLSEIIVSSGKAQHAPFENWGVGLNAGLYGAGVQGATSLSPHFKWRAGFDYFTYRHSDAIEFEVIAAHNGHEADAQIQGLQAKLAPVESEINEIQQEQADAELIKKQDARIAELKGQQKKLGISLAQLDSMIHLAELFVQLKAADVEAEVNGSFHTVRWKLFEMQVNGGVKACCEAQVDGKDYGSLSKSEKVNAGLDIVDTLGRKMGLVMPVWHDDAESVSHPMEIDAQTISLYVSDVDKALRTENNDKEDLS